jgi:hypothetical protein
MIDDWLSLVGVCLSVCLRYPTPYREYTDVDFDLDLKTPDTTSTTAVAISIDVCGLIHSKLLTRHRISVS